MTINLLTLLTASIGLTSTIFHGKHFLSLLLGLELSLLSLMVFSLYMGLINGDNSHAALAIFIVTMAAIEGSIGISIMTLLSRNFNSNNLSTLNTLKS